MTLKCPACSAVIQADDAYAGLEGECPTCGADILVGQPPVPPSTPPTKPVSARKLMTADERSHARNCLISIGAATLVTWLLPKLGLGYFLALFGVTVLPWWIYALLFVLTLLTTAGILLTIEDRKKAKQEYENALLKLKDDPNNPDLRLETLRLGRLYSDLTRDAKGRSLFDEVAMMNDINAACARANNTHSPVSSNNPTARPSNH